MHDGVKQRGSDTSPLMPGVHPDPDYEFLRVGEPIGLGEISRSDDLLLLRGNPAPGLEFWVAQTVALSKIRSVHMQLRINGIIQGGNSRVMSGGGWQDIHNLISMIIGSLASGGHIIVLV